MLEALREWLRALLLGENQILLEIRKTRYYIQRMESTMATQADIDQLVTRVQAVDTAVTTGVAGIRSDIEALKAANPGVDTSALEASVSQLESDTGTLTELDAENPGAPAEPTA